jgi:hypothetical protein
VDKQVAITLIFFPSPAHYVPSYFVAIMLSPMHMVAKGNQLQPLPQLRHPEKNVNSRVVLTYPLLRIWQTTHHLQHTVLVAIEASVQSVSADRFGKPLMLNEYRDIDTSMPISANRCRCQWPR